MRKRRFWGAGSRSAKRVIEVPGGENARIRKGGQWYDENYGLPGVTPRKDSVEFRAGQRCGSQSNSGKGDAHLSGKCQIDPGGPHKKTGIAASHLSDMESGKRDIGYVAAQKLGKALKWECLGIILFGRLKQSPHLIKKPSGGKMVKAPEDIWISTYPKFL